MKCLNCGKEIANDSNFCEYCGTKVQTSKSKKSFWIVLPILLALCISLIILDVFSDESFGKQTRYEEAMCDTTETDSIEFVDLGLPSGTLWENKNVSEGFYTYREAKKKFGKGLPTKKQCEELIKSSQWKWTGNGYEVTGPNGNSITLQAMGYREYDGRVYYVGSYGSYWSSTLLDPDTPWSLRFDNSSKPEMGYGGDYAGYAVRLVKRK